MVNSSHSCTALVGPRIVLSRSFPFPVRVVVFLPRSEELLLLLVCAALVGTFAFLGCPFACFCATVVFAAAVGLEVPLLVAATVVDAPPEGPGTPSGRSL